MSRHDYEDEFEMDPIGNLRKSIQRMESREALRDLHARVTAQVQQYAKQNPDYQARVQHVMERRASELAALGANQQQIAQALEQESMQLAIHGLRTGKNPGEIISQLADAKGFKPTTAPAKQPSLDDLLRETEQPQAKETPPDPWADERNHDEQTEAWEQRQLNATTSDIINSSDDILAERIDDILGSDES